MTAFRSQVSAPGECKRCLAGLLKNKNQKAFPTVRMKSVRFGEIGDMDSDFPGGWNQDTSTKRLPKLDTIFTVRRD